MILIYSQSLLLYCIYGFVLYCFVIGRENSTCAFNQSDTRIEHPISEHTSSQSSVFFRTIIETKRIEDEHSGSNVCAEAEFSMSMQRAFRLSEPSYLIRVTKNRTSQYAKVFVWSAPNRMVNKQDTSTWIGFVRFERAECCQLLIRVSLECCCCFASSQLVFFHRWITFFCFPYRILSFIVVSFVIMGVSYTFS